MVANFAKKNKTTQLLLLQTPACCVAGFLRDWVQVKVPCTSVGLLYKARSFVLGLEMEVLLVVIVWMGSYLGG